MSRLPDPQAETNPPADLRAEINQIDAEIRQAFFRRMVIARQIGARKASRKTPVRDLEREQEILDRARAEGGADANAAELLFRELMSLSRSAQYNILAGQGAAKSLLPPAVASETAGLRIVCQGSSGAYAHAAALLLYPDAAPQFAPTFAAACDAVVAGAADVAVLPIENSTAGAVQEIYGLLEDYHLYIRRSATLLIRHQLLGRPGTSQTDIKTVLSHPQALAQCHDYIRAQGWTAREALNTATAARQVAASDEPGLAAIASVRAAAETGLIVLSDDIQDARQNRTRFVAVSRDRLLLPDASRLSLICTVPHQRGTLAAVLAVFAAQDLSLNRIESRPNPENPWTYRFQIDIACRTDQRRAVETALLQLQAETEQLHVFGWYPEIDEGGVTT